MRPIQPITLLLACSLLAACGGGGGAGDGGDDNDNVAPFTLFVSVVNGDDGTGDGSEVRPFKTISRALEVAKSGNLVRVGAGEYSALTGELFPLLPASGVTIRGVELDSLVGRNRLSKIEGGGFGPDEPAGRLHATIIPGTGCHLIGLDLVNPAGFTPIAGPTAAIALAREGVTVESCALHGSNKGIRLVEGATETLITECTFFDNHSGVSIDGAFRGNRVEHSYIVGNTTGVMAITGGVDFGGGLAGSVGENTFAENDEGDFIHIANEFTTTFAENCFWDRVPPMVALGQGPSSPDADVYILSGAVEFSGAKLYVPLDPPVADPDNPMFKGASN